MHASPSPNGQPHDCASCLAAVCAVVAGDADVLTAARVDAHTAGCASCRAALATARAYRRVMRRVGAAARAPAALRGRVQDLARGLWGSRSI